MLTAKLIRLLQILVAVGLGWWLTRSVGPWAALGICAAVATVAVAIAVTLLRTAPIGRINWKNRVAGVLILPWAFTIGRGSLMWIAIACVGMWIALGASGILLAVPGNSAVPASGGWTASLVQGLLVAAWVVDGAGMIYILGVLIRNNAPASSASMTLYKLLGFIVVILGASVALWMIGRPGWALLMAGGPPFALASGYGAFLLMVLLAGKNVRWN